MNDSRPHQLSKSRFVAGYRCHRLLWWTVHEPNAVELQPDKVLQDRFDQGAQVEELARALFADGAMVALPHTAVAERVEETNALVAQEVPAVFRGTFVADDTRVDVDVLERDGDGWRLIEVKSSNSQKEEHVVDAAVQLHVLRRSGLDVRSAEILHLNGEYRFPTAPSALGPRLSAELFQRTDVTASVEQLLPMIPDEIEAQRAMLDGPIPAQPVGLHCSEPHDCPFMDRCWPDDPDEIGDLYWVGRKKRREDWVAEGITRISQIPAKKKLNDVQRRQIKSIRENTLIVEPTLAKALEPFEVRLGFLDFETIQRAVPVWPGMGPWEQAAAQFSFHIERAPRDRLRLVKDISREGAENAEQYDVLEPQEPYDHYDFLAEGPLDCRPALARAMVEATKDAQRVVTYSSFEKTRIKGLQQAVPELRAELEALEHKLIDLLPVIQKHVYHPKFDGSFSLKKVLPALVPELSYSDLVIVDGLAASVEIARLLFVAGKIAPEEQARVRRDLLNYCDRDTWAMVRLLETLRRLA